METSFYETNKAVSEYLLFHYGKPDDIFLNGVGSTEALDFLRVAESFTRDSNLIAVVPSISVVP